MGFYVNPVKETKEHFLQNSGKYVAHCNLRWGIQEKGDALICLIDHGTHTAAGIAFSQQEFERFRGCKKLQIWYTVPIKALEHVTNVPLDIFED